MLDRNIFTNNLKQKGIRYTEEAKKTNNKSSFFCKWIKRNIFFNQTKNEENAYRTKVFSKGNNFLQHNK